MDQDIRERIENADIIIQNIISDMIGLRQSAPAEQRYLYSYVSKKIDAAGKSIGLALDKIEEIEREKAKV